MLNKYEYKISSAQDTGFPVASCINKETGLIVRTPLASNERSFPGFIAYVGAKFSRSRAGLLQLMTEVEGAYQEGKLVPEGRLANITQGLKHQSPGGMAHVAIAMEGLSMLTAASLFRRTALHDGQEASTRYIEFGKGNKLPDLKTLLPEGTEVTGALEEEYGRLEEESLKLYQGWYSLVYSAYKEHFKIDPENKNEVGALSARTYDTVRGFLLSGFKTSMIYVTNATTLQQVLADFGAERLPGEKQLADTVLALMRPETPVEGYHPEIAPLLNHTEAFQGTRTEQIQLEHFFRQSPDFNALLTRRRQFSGLVENGVQLIPANVSASDRIVAQHLMVLHPSLRMRDILEYAGELNDYERAEVGRIIFANRDRFHLPSIAGSGGPVSLYMGIDLGIERDLGRHRAWERVSVAQETYLGFGEIGESGFTQAEYLGQIEEFSGIQKGMEGDMLEFYEKRKTFLENLEKEVGEKAADKVGMYLLPLAHQTKMIMNSDIRNTVHLEDTRIRPGAHISARLVTAEANRLVANSDPLYSTLLYPRGQVVVDSREQFISRD